MKIEQGLYRQDNNIIYLAYCPASENWFKRYLFVNSIIGNYSVMWKIRALEAFRSTLTPIHIGWLPNDAIPSELYPEYFI